MQMSLLRGPVPRQLSIDSDALRDVIAAQAVVIFDAQGRPVEDATAYDLDAGWVDTYSGLRRGPSWLTTRRHIPFAVRWINPLAHAGSGLETPEE